MIVDRFRFAARGMLFVACGALAACSHAGGDSDRSGTGGAGGGSAALYACEGDYLGSWNGSGPVDSDDMADTGDPGVQGDVSGSFGPSDTFSISFAGMFDATGTVGDDGTFFAMKTAGGQSGENYMFDGEFDLPSCTAQGSYYGGGARNYTGSWKMTLRK